MPKSLIYLHRKVSDDLIGWRSLMYFPKWEMPRGVGMVSCTGLYIITNCNVSCVSAKNLSNNRVNSQRMRHRLNSVLHYISSAFALNSIRTFQCTSSLFLSSSLNESLPPFKGNSNRNFGEFFLLCRHDLMGMSFENFKPLSSLIFTWHHATVCSSKIFDIIW